MVRVLAAAVSIAFSFSTILLPQASTAASVLGDTFSVDFRCFGCVNGGPSDHVAELPAAGFRIFDERGYSTQLDEVAVQWIDEDTFAFIVYFDSVAEDDIVLELTGLDFADGMTPRAIDGISTNTSLTDCPAEFASCPDAVGPFTSFKEDSVRIEYSQSNFLRGDGPVWAFDISTVPEPAALAFWVSGLLGIAIRGRRAGTR